MNHPPLFPVTLTTNDLEMVAWLVELKDVLDSIEDLACDAMSATVKMRYLKEIVARTATAHVVRVKIRDRLYG